MKEPLSQDEWTRWIGEHAPRLLLFARQLTRTEADAQDLVQDAFLECWRRNGPGAPALPLLFATLRRRAIDLARRENRRANREQSATEPGSQSWFDGGAEEREFSRVIQAALAELPAEQREVVTLKIWGELTFVEIGEALGISPNTAASRYRYGLAELRRHARQVLT